MFPLVLVSLIPHSIQCMDIFADCHSGTGVGGVIGGGIGGFVGGTVNGLLGGLTGGVLRTAEVPAEEKN